MSPKDLGSVTQLRLPILEWRKDRPQNLRRKRWRQEERSIIQHKIFSHSKDTKQLTTSKNSNFSSRDTYNLQTTSSETLNYTTAETNFNCEVMGPVTDDRKGRASQLEAALSRISTVLSPLLNPDHVTEQREERWYKKNKGMKESEGRSPLSVRLASD